MTGAWFPTLSAMKDGKLPLKLFSVGLRFRREQKVDATHLRAHYGGSIVVMDDGMSNEAGKKLTKEVMEYLGFKDINFVKKKATSNYYAPDTEYEVYSGDIEIADIGMYSPVALANYDIPHHVFNLGFGLERMLMVKNRVGDVRELLYPQFYQTVDLSDSDIAKNLAIGRKPETSDGREIAESIKKTAVEHAREKSPCSFTAYKGGLLGKTIVVDVVEKEADTSLLGPAALNGIYVHDGGVYGLPEDTSKLKTDVSGILKKGVKVEFGLIDALASYFAAEIEFRVGRGEPEGAIQVKMAKSAGDVNIALDDRTRRFILSKNRQISIKGPVFTAVSYRIV